MKPKIRVLIVDDSSIIRTLFSRILATDPEIEVVGTAPDPYSARDKIISLNPDVMTLDVEMPKMDGITFLEKLMKTHPVRTIIISSLTASGSETALRGLQAGAIDVIAKPAIDVTQGLQAMAKTIITQVKLAAQAKLETETQKPPTQSSKRPIQNSALAKTTHQIIGIASSTGGTEALKVVLSQLPADVPGILIVQHMPPVFTKTYAEHLKAICQFDVREAVDGERVLPGQALIAPGNFHMELTRSGAYYYVKLHQAPLLHGVRPAADFLLKSIAKYAGSNAIGVVLTGMGKDGAEGLLEMKAAGSYNIAQDEKTCVVFGMPRTAIEAGAIHTVLPLHKISNELIAQMKQREVA